MRNDFLAGAREPLLSGLAGVAGRALRGARLLPGKRVLNGLPSDFPTKGDDRTDEDVFRIGEPEVVGVLAP